MIKTFDLIVNKENITQAYFDIVGKFDSKSKSSGYVGIDGVVLNDYNFISSDFIEDIYSEMKSFLSLSPANNISIPKKNGGKRNIYIYSIKERVKAESIYRVLEPLLNQFISPYVYSYRTSHPSYYAIRTITRRYKRYFGEDYILTADLSDYTDSMDQSLLLKKITKLGIDKDTSKLIELFITSSVVSKGRVLFPKKGLMTGTPLSGLLANLFMEEFDSWAGKYVSVYRRIGDDMIALDKNKEKVTEVYRKLKETVLSHNLILNEKKVQIVKNTETFVFLGYKFSSGKISFDPRSIKKTFTKWKIDLHRYPGKNINRKLKHFKYMFFHRNTTLDHEIKQLIKQKILIDDDFQIKAVSEKFYRLITEYFFGKYTPGNRRKLIELLYKNDCNVHSIYHQYINVHFNKYHGK